MDEPETGIVAAIYTPIAGHSYNPLKCRVALINFMFGKLPAHLKVYWKNEMIKMMYGGNF